MKVKKITRAIGAVFVLLLLLTVAPASMISDVQEPVQRAYKQLHFQGMGSFNWFKLAAWNVGDRPEALQEAERLIKTIKRHGYWDSSGVMWLSSGKAYHRNLNKKTPWESFKLDGKLIFDFEHPSKKFWKLWRLWLTLHKKHHLKFVPILMMREDYCWYPFSNNVNGVDGIYSQKALKVILRYMRKAVRIYIEVYGKTPKVIPWNEPAHYGSGEEFHRVMYNHEAVWEQVLKPAGGRLQDMWIDLTLCEGAGGELIEIHLCPKPGNCDRNGWHGKEGQGRKMLGIKHGFTTLSDFLIVLSNGRTKIDNILASKNKWRLFTEDGGGHVNDGNYIVKKIYRLGDAQQQYEMMWVLCQRHFETGKLLIFGTFPHEALIYDEDQNLFIPDYRKESINWGRIKNGVLKACQDFYGD